MRSLPPTASTGRVPRAGSVVPSRSARQPRGNRRAGGNSRDYSRAGADVTVPIKWAMPTKHRGTPRREAPFGGALWTRQENGQILTRQLGRSARGLGNETEE